MQKISEWKFIKKNVGKKVSIYDCFYCGLNSEDVECGGVYSCPNGRCTGPGGAWFRRTLKSYQEEDGGRHSVDDKEWDMAWALYKAKLEYEQEYGKEEK